MVFLVIMAIIGIIAVILGLWYLIKKKFPRASDKVEELGDKFISGIKKEKNQEGSENEGN